MFTTFILCGKLWKYLVKTAKYSYFHLKPVVLWNLLLFFLYKNKWKVQEMTWQPKLQLYFKSIKWPLKFTHIWTMTFRCIQVCSGVLYIVWPFPVQGKGPKRGAMAGWLWPLNHCATDVLNIELLRSCLSLGLIIFLFTEKSYSNKDWAWQYCDYALS